jgi:hypothetical protein
MDEVRAMLEAGVTFAMIAETFGCNIRTARTFARKVLGIRNLKRKNSQKRKRPPVSIPMPQSCAAWGVLRRVPIAMGGRAARHGAARAAIHQLAGGILTRRGCCGRRGDTFQLDLRHRFAFKIRVDALDFFALLAFIFLL